MLRPHFEDLQQPFDDSVNAKVSVALVHSTVADVSSKIMEKFGVSGNALRKERHREVLALVALMDSIRAPV